MTTFKPTDPQEVAATVQWAASNEAALEIVGHGSKRGVGAPVSSEHVLDTTKLSGVTLYEPGELVLSARAGTPIAKIERLLHDNGQQFAFEPPDYGALLGRKSKLRGTAGGMLAANLSGSRRLKAGAARDHILGVHAVSGRGEVFKSGGRVVKNVTGYDMSKLMAGSWGTLAVLTDVTFKVLPAAETETTLALRGLLDDAASSAMALAMGSSQEVSGAAHLPQNVASRVAGGALGSAAATLLRVEGFGPSVAYRIGRLKQLYGAGNAIEEISGEVSRRLWRDVSDCMPFADGTENPVWRVSLAPTQAHRMVMALRMQIPVDAFYDWQGGLAWLRFEVASDHELLRKTIRDHGGGHATLMRASAAERAAVPVFEPQAPLVAGLSGRLKAQFDPKNILNPGRMG